MTVGKLADIDYRIDGKNAEILFGIKASEYYTLLDETPLLDYAYENTWTVEINLERDEVERIWKRN